MGLTIIGRRSNQLDKSHLKKVVGPSRVHSRLTPVDNRKNHFLDSVKFHLYSIDVDPSRIKIWINKFSGIYNRNVKWESLKRKSSLTIYTKWLPGKRFIIDEKKKNTFLHRRTIKILCGPFHTTAQKHNPEMQRYLNKLAK